MSTWSLPNSEIAAFDACRQPVPRWYAVQTRSNFEVKVAEQLTARGVEVYLPAFDELHRWKDRVKKISIPVFPGYVFGRFADVPRQRLSVVQTFGVARILGLTETIEAIPDREIESVRLLLAARVSCFHHPFLREGVRVRVNRGALKGLEGILVRVKNQSRVVVSVMLLSQSVAAEIDACDVAPL